MSQHLIIENADVRFKLEGQALNIIYPDRKPTSIPLRMLEQITLLANIEVPVQLLHKLAQQGIGISVMDRRNHNALTHCISHTHGEFKRRERQYALIHDPKICLDASRSLIKAKLMSQSEHLLELGKKHFRHRRKLLQGQQGIEAIIPSLQEANSQQLLGMEGTAARLYFQSYCQVFPEQWGFHYRNKRPPKDPVNALLSLGYTLLTREASQALYRVGLDPAFGFFHKVSSGRHSLACDLAELYRCEVDRLVLRLVESGQIKTTDFGYQLEACLLNKEGRKLFFPRFQKEMTTCRRALRITAMQWVNSLMAAPLPHWHEQG